MSELDSEDTNDPAFKGLCCGVVRLRLTLVDMSGLLGSLVWDDAKRQEQDVPGPPRTP